MACQLLTIPVLTKTDLVKVTSCLSNLPENLNSSLERNV